MSGAAFRTNPSTIARYFFLDCERFIRYRAEPNNPSVPPTAYDTSPVMNAILESGSVWELEILQQRLAGKVHIAPGDGELTGRVWNWQRSIELMEEVAPGEYIFQPTLRVPERFYRSYGLDPDRIHISDNRPDLIEVRQDEDGHRLLRVIDIKRGRSLQMTYRIQVLLYALELASIVEDRNLNVRADLEHGAAWLGKCDNPEIFEFSGVRTHVERFLSSDLARILAENISDVGWHLRYRCEWCEYFEHCQSHMVASNNISRLSGLTSHGKRFLERQHQVRSLDELRVFLSRSGVDDHLKQCASLVGQRPRLQAQLDSYSKQGPVPVGSIHPGLPVNEHIALFITLQEEPLGEHTYLVGLLVQGRPELRKELLGEEGQPYPYVLAARLPEHTQAICEALVERLYEVLRRVDAWNREHEWKEQLIVQAYTFTEQERLSLIGVLLRCLENAEADPELAEKAAALIFHFQAPDLMLAEEHPGGPVAFPVITLANALGRLAALPVDVSYTLPESLSALGSKLRYSRNDEYHFPLGHALRSDPIHRIWANPSDNGTLEPLRKEGALRLFAMRELLRQLRHHFQSAIVHWPPRFKLITERMAEDPLLSRLAFLTLYESLLRCTEVRGIRSESREMLSLAGQLIEIESLTPQEFAVVSPPVEIEGGGFPSWLLVRDTSEGLRTQLAYNDYANRARAWGGSKDPHVGVVGVDVTQEDALGGATRLRLKWSRELQTEVRRGERFLLMPRFTDFISDKVITYIRQLDQHPRGMFAELISHPDRAAAPIDMDSALQGRADDVLGRLGFTSSQKDAWKTICSHRVVAVWGPPGTGKTHFLATMVVGLAMVHAELGRTFHVLVTAFTHAAIENLLAKIHEQAALLAPRLKLQLGKAGGWKSQGTDLAERVEAKDAGKWLKRQQLAVLGSTVHACRKADGMQFDLVLIDEASQLKVPEASIPVTQMKPDGRLVLAGDHFQLGPILAGRYPDPPNEAPKLHASIFDLVRGDEHRKGVPVCQLLENFRMNDVLTDVAAQLLYGARYRCANDKITQQRLAVSNLPEGLAAACLDPSSPLVVAILDGVVAAKENVIEARLVAELTLALREGMADVANDQQFFERDLFIVSPHHAQIRLIRQELRTRRNWSSPPFVDTVDKMQGREARAVLVSYGIADPEFALREAEFIYGLNRLNVAITRAREKCVVFLPRPLLEATPEVLDNEVAAAGLSYMRRLIKLCEEQAGRSVCFQLEGSTSLQVLTARPSLLI